MNDTPPRKVIYASAVGSLSFSGKANATSLEPVPAGHEIFALIGELTAEAARVEKLLDIAIARLTMLDNETASCITGQLIGPGPRFQSILQILDLRNLADLTADAKRLYRDSGARFDARNRAVHDPWLIERSDSEKLYQSISRPRDKKVYGNIEKSVVSMKTEVQKMRSFREDVTSFYNNIWERTR